MSVASASTALIRYAPMGTALIPYTPPRTPLEFIQTEVEKSLKNDTINLRKLTTRSSLQPPVNLNWGTIEKIFAEHFDMLNSSLSPIDMQQFDVLHPISCVSSANMKSDAEIAEALTAEAVFTIASDSKPIVATYGASTCIACGGYEATNKIAFVVHFSNAGEVRTSGGLLFYNISNLVKQKFEIPIQLHLRGGVKGHSEAIVEAIQIWMKKRDDLPMEIASKDILGNGIRGKSLSIDSRTGEVAEYVPLANPNSRRRSELNVTSAIMSAYKPGITIAYSPNSGQNPKDN